MFRDFDDSVGGEISFGGYDKSKIVGDIHYVPISRSDAWQITVDKIVMNNIVVGCPDGYEVSKYNCFVPFFRYL